MKRSHTPTESFWDLDSIDSRLGDTHLNYEPDNEGDDFEYGHQEGHDQFFDVNEAGGIDGWHHDQDEMIGSGTHEEDEQVEEDDEVYGSMTNPSKPLDLVKKAVTSGQKEEGVPSKLDEEGDLYLNAVKWLTRAEGSIMKDPDLLAYIKQYYDVKEDKAGNASDRGRARHKGNKWYNLMNTSSVRFEDPLKHLVETTGERYKAEAESLWEEFRRQQQQRASQEILESLDAQRQRLVALKKSWYKVTDPLKAMAIAKMELRMFKGAWESEVNNESGERNYVVAHLMRVHAANAVAWNMKARQLAQERLADLVTVRKAGPRERRTRRQRPQ